jgi:hypothetical protein
MAYRLKNAKLENFTNLAGSPPSPFRQKKIRIIGDDDEVITSSDMLQGDDSDFDIDYTGASNLEPIVLSNKKISKKEQERIISEESSKPKIKSTIGSTEFDDIADRERYDETMAPLITDMKDSVRSATNRAAGIVLDAGLFAAPVPGAGLIAKGIGKGLRFTKNLVSPITSKMPKLNLNLSSTFKPTPNLTTSQIKLNLPDSPGIFGRFNPKTKQSMFDALNLLAKGADVSKTQRLATIKRLKSPEGRKRLYDQEFGYLQDQFKKLDFSLKNNPKSRFLPQIREAEAAIKQGKEPFLQYNMGTNILYDPAKNLFKSQIPKVARENVEKRIFTISQPNINEMAKGAIKGGKLDYSKAYKLLYGEKSPPKDIMFGRGATFGGFGDRIMDTYSIPSFSGVKRSMDYNIGEFVLGGSKVGGKGQFSFMNPRTYQHELQHGLQAGRTTPLDISLAKIKPGSIVKKYNRRLDDAIAAKQNIKATDKNFFTAYPKAKAKVTKLESNPPRQVTDYNYFRYGGSGQMEPRAFAAELRQSLLDKGFIKDVYQPITPNILSSAKKYFAKNPFSQGALKSPTGQTFNVSGTRLLDFASGSKSNLGQLSKLMNKLPTVTLPILGGTTLKFSGDRK